MIDLVKQFSAAKMALHYDFITRSELKEALTTFYREMEMVGSTEGILFILEREGCVTSKQHSSLLQRVNSNDNVDIKNRRAVEVYLGLRKRKSEVSVSDDGLFIISCNHCPAKFKLKKLPKQVTKFKCGKCQKYFIVSAPSKPETSRHKPVAQQERPAKEAKPQVSSSPNRKILAVDIEAMFSKDAMFIGTKFDTPMLPIPQDYEDGYTIFQ
ncbi:hypothetical protein [Candidatus Uabimicrobium sp. HlEnr_7]|uniref:hypothetical protein n=1 Tax=Candidatus Uabimicrobium helgolandensis TaxID=3095367 RepID=UPI0035574FAF